MSELESSPPGTAGSDFLFYLYRGRELLEDHCPSDALLELERALALQPNDLEVRGLLGLAHSRLGQHARASEIYQGLSSAAPRAVAPRINLALSYVKAGQRALARQVLEELTAWQPGEKRAWAYLALLYQGDGEFSRAELAFQKAELADVAARASEAPSRDPASTPDDDPEPTALERDLLRSTAAALVDQVDSGEAPFSRDPPTRVVGRRRSPRWRAIEPGQEARPEPAAPPSLVGRFGPAVPLLEQPGELARPSLRTLPIESLSALTQSVRIEPRSAPAPASPAEPLNARSLETDQGFALRASTLRAALPGRRGFESRALLRRVRGRETSEPLGAPRETWLLLGGAGRILVAVAASHRLFSLELTSSLLYVPEPSLVAFPAAARYESGRLATGSGEALPIVQLSGHGTVLLETRGSVQALDVSGEAPLWVRTDQLLGWSGRLLGQPLDVSASPGGVTGFLSFSGAGSVFVDLA